MSPDLMPCQLCFGKPAFSEEDDQSTLGISEWENVECEDCGVAGPRSYWDSSDRIKSGRDFIIFSDRQTEKHRPNAAASWNRMQALLAKAILTEDMVTTGRKEGGRL